MRNVLKILVIAAIAIVVLWTAFSVLHRSNGEVVNAFEKINNKLSIVNDSLNSQEREIYQELDYNSEDSLLINLVDISDTIRFEIRNLKENILSGNSVGEMDNSRKLDSIFFTENGISNQGKDFTQNLLAYRWKVQEAFALKNIDYPDELLSSFPQEQSSSLGWLEYNFKGFPTIASVTKLTSLENDILSLNNLFLNKK